jgi:hypothetical protein
MFLKTFTIHSFAAVEYAYVHVNEANIPVVVQILCAICLHASLYSLVDKNSVNASVKWLRLKPLISLIVP